MSMSKSKEFGLVKTYQKVDMAKVMGDGAMTNEEIERGMERKNVNLLAIDNEFKLMTGQILTLVDATMSDPIQRKAMKDVMKTIIYGSLENLFAYADLK